MSAAVVYQLQLTNAAGGLEGATEIECRSNIQAVVAGVSHLKAHPSSWAVRISTSAGPVAKFTREDF